MPGSGPLTEGPVPASAPVASRLFVLPVATRRWILTDNNYIKGKKIPRFQFVKNEAIKFELRCFILSPTPMTEYIKFQMAA